MPPAARTNDLTSHGPPLNPGPGSPDVLIGFLPAWRAVPAGMGAGIESASDTMNNLMTSPSLDPATTPAKLSQVFAALSQDTGTAASKGAPGAPAATSSSQATLMTANVALTATYTAAAAVPGGEPAARVAYTEGIKAAAAAAMSAAMSAMAGMADMHICPIPVPIPPHGPGFVTKGSKSVFINNLPACREGDKVFEAAGGSDPIALGCQTVLIGDSGGGGGGGGGAAGGGAEAQGSGAQHGGGAPAGAGGSSSAAGASHPTQTPTAAELQNNRAVRGALRQAWRDSQPNDPNHRHEEGGWVYMNTTTGRITTRRAPAGEQAALDLNSPPEVPGSVVVGKFHTHPNPTSEGWEPGPSDADVRNADRHGVPSLVRADDGNHSCGPDRRRGGLGGGPGYPP